MASDDTKDNAGNEERAIGLDEILYGPVEDTDGDGMVTDDYLKDMRTRLRPAVEPLDDAGRKKLLEMRDLWLAHLSALGLDDSENNRAVVTRVLAIILGDDDASADDIRDWVATMMMALSCTRVTVSK